MLLYLSAIDSVLTAISPVVDDNHVDLVHMEQINDPPVVSWTTAVSYRAMTPVSVGFAVYSSHSVTSMGFTGLSGEFVLRQQHCIGSSSHVSTYRWVTSGTEHLHLRQRQVVLGLLNPDYPSLSSAAVNWINFDSFFVVNGSTDVLVNLDDCAVNSALATIPAVVDDDEVYRMLSLKINLPPTVLVVSGVRRGSSAPVSVGVTINSS